MLSQLPIFLLFLTALDAYVLLEIYDRFIEIARREKMDIDLAPSLTVKWSKDSKLDKMRARAKNYPPTKSTVTQVFSATWN